MDAVKQVRLLIADLDDNNPVFTKDQIEGYLALEGQNPKRAAASALAAIAISEAMIAKVIRTQDLHTDGAKLADSLRALADRLRKEADDEEDAGLDGISVIEFEPYRIGF